MIKKINWQIILIFLISLAVVFYQYLNIPKYLAFDEVEFTKLALSLDKKFYTPYSPLATGHSTLYFYIILLSFKIFGVNTFALRLPSAIFSILSIIIFYLILKMIYEKEKNQFIKKYFPLILSFVLITLRWFFNFARFAFEAPFLLFLELLSVYFFIKAINDKKNLLIIFSGIFAGLAFNSYTPGRIFFLLPLGFLFFRLKKEKKFFIKKLLIFIIPFIITITPLTNYLLTNKDHRIDQLFFWKNHQLTLEEKINGTIQNINSLFLMFFYKGDINGKHNYPGKPALNPLLAIFVFLGILIALKNFLKKENFYDRFFLIYFILSLIPSIPIYPWENPNMLRTYTVIPSLIYFIANSLSYLIKDFPYDKIKINKKIVYFVIFLMIFLSSFYELRTYFYYQKKVFQDAFEMKKPLEEYLKNEKIF